MRKMLFAAAAGGLVLSGTGAQAQSLTILHRNDVSGFAQGANAGGDAGNRPVTLTTLRTNPDGRSSQSVTTLDFGVTKVAAVINGGNGAGAEARGNWQDFLTLTTPGAASGFVTVRLIFAADISRSTVNGSIATINFEHLFTASPMGGLVGGLYSYVYQYTYQGNIFNNQNNFVFENNNNDSSVTYFAFQDSIGKSVDLRIPFVSGQAFRLDSSTSCSVGSIGGNPGCDAGNSSYWGGVRSVTNTSGAVLSGWTLSSASGVDYAASMAPAVPEPASWLMLITGFGLVGALGRRRRALAA
jgi:hypothetical protein